MKNRCQHPLYMVWKTMTRRCRSPGATSYSLYGGRGIRVCERWQGPGGFERFVVDVGDRPSSAHSLDRYPDKDGHYEPGNVRWATWEEQNNNSRNNTLIAAGGESLSVAQWARRLGIEPSAIFHRLRKGWPPEAAVSLPRWARRP